MNRETLLTSWRERLVQADPRREFRQWNMVRIVFRPYQRERNRYDFNAVPIVHAARVEVTVTPGESSPSSLSVEVVAFDTPTPETLEVPPWEKP